MRVERGKGRLSRLVGRLMRLPAEGEVVAVTLRIEPTPEGGTRVTETFDMSTARSQPALRLFGYPRRHRDNVASSVSALISHFAPA